MSGEFGNDEMIFLSEKIEKLDTKNLQDKKILFSIAENY